MASKGIRPSTQAGGHMPKPRRRPAESSMWTAVSILSVGTLVLCLIWITMAQQAMMHRLPTVRHGFTGAASAKQVKLGLNIRTSEVKSPPAPPPLPAHPALGNCPETVTPFSLDCHILQAERANPYLLSEMRDRGLLPDPLAGENVCSDPPGATSSRPLLNNLHIDRSFRDEPPREGMRVMCMVLTYSKKHRNNLEALRQTWGHRCHGFVAFSNQTDPNIPAVTTPVFGGERYTNTWQKMRALWKYTWFHYSNEFDWFFKVDDDTYVIWENLMEYLASDELQRKRREGGGLMLGRKFWLEGKQEKQYDSGGAGYILDRAALGKLVGKLDTKECDMNGQHQWEDLYAGMCLKHAGVLPSDTRDDKGRQRFMPMKPANHYMPRGGRKDWYDVYSGPHGFKQGLECCSRRTISFHYQPEKAMLQTHRHLYKCRTDAEATQV